MRLMCCGHVFGARRVMAFVHIAGVACHARAVDENLKHAAGNPQIHLFAHQVIGYAVIVLIQLYVVIDIDARAPPVGDGKTHGGEFAQMIAIQQFKCLFTRAR